MFRSGTVTSFCEKHVLTLIITFSAAVMNGHDPNMFGMSSIANMFRDGTVVLCSFRDSNASFMKNMF